MTPSGSVPSTDSCRDAPKRVALYRRCRWCNGIGLDVSPLYRMGEQTWITCPKCGGTGRIREVSR